METFNAVVVFVLWLLGITMFAGITTLITLEFIEPAWYVRLKQRRDNLMKRMIGE